MTHQNIILITIGLFAIAPCSWVTASPVAESQAIGDGLAWLEGDQNTDGSWGNDLQLTVTSTVLDTLTDTDLCNASVADGAVWLGGRVAENNDFRARQILGLAESPGFETTARDLTLDLLGLRNPKETDSGLPNWPEGGWGLDDGFETDSLTTGLALLALDATGFNGGFDVANGSVPAGGSTIHEWEIPTDAVSVTFLITVAGSQIRLCMTEGSPPPFCSSYFPLLGGPFLITLPDDGLPFTPGTNFLMLESTGPAATYTLQAAYQTPTFDTRMLAEPLAYLREAQNVDGGWGLQRGLPSEIYTAQHALLALLNYSQYDLASEIAAGIAYLKTEQLGDGSFGIDGSPVPYITAHGALSLIRGETPNFSVETENAVTALLGQQDVDGSWTQEAYDTGVAVLALWEHGLPPTAVAGLDQEVGDSDGDCAEVVSLSGSGSDGNGTIVGYRWTENCVELSTSSSPAVPLSIGTHVIKLTVTDNDGLTDTDTVVVNVVDASDHDGDQVSTCAGDCDDTNDQIWNPPTEIVDLMFSAKDTLTWGPPLSQGSISVAYDVLRSDDPSDFEGAGTVCVEADEVLDTLAHDSDPVASGAVYFYLVRAENDCPDGLGSLGSDSDGTPRTGLDCN